MVIQINTFIKRHIIAIVILVCSIIIGLIVYKDYGISIDERVQRNLGLLTYNYVFHGDKSLKSNDVNRDYGVAFNCRL